MGRSVGVCGRARPADPIEVKLADGKGGRGYGGGGGGGGEGD